MNVINNHLQRTPAEVVKALQIEPTTLNPYFFTNHQKELATEKVFSGRFSIDLSTIYSVARKATLVALVIIGTGLILTTAFFNPLLLFPVIVGVSLTFYKIVPLLLAPMERQENKHRLHKKNLEKTCQIEKDLQKLTVDELKATYLTPLKIPTTLQGNELKGEELKTFIIPILARHLFWKEAIQDTKKACEALKEEYEKVKTALAHDEDKTVPLKKVQKKQLEQQALSINYRLFDMEESDLPLVNANGLMPSALKAAYLLHIMQNPLEMKDFSDYGVITPKQKYERELEGIPSMKNYFVMKKKQIDRASLITVIDKIEEIEQRVFAA